MSNSINVKQLVLDAMLAAMCAVLGFLAIDLQGIKITFEGFPVLVGALLFGPGDGLVIGAVGTFLYQMIRYGFTATTLLWVLPYALSGLFVGLYAKHKKFTMGKKQIFWLAIINEIVITIINTGSILADAKMYGWYYPGLILKLLPFRILICIGKGVIYGLVIPALLVPLKKIVLTQNGMRKARSSKR